MDVCIFCKIVNGEIPCFKIYETDDYLAFLDISQFTRGHTIVVPKKHIEFVWDSEEIGEYYAVVQKVANHFRAKGYKYVDSLIFGRDVAHSHVHLIPHNNEDGDYKNALEKIGLLQSDPSRHPSISENQLTASELKL